MTDQNDDPDFLKALVMGDTGKGRSTVVISQFLKILDEQEADALDDDSS